MADLKDDIEKYLRGELTPSEMHALEKRALSDPFLADALEGANLVLPDDFKKDLVDLQQRFSRHNREKNKWLIPLRIAASLVLLLAVTYVVYLFIKPEMPVTIAQQASRVPRSSPNEKVEDTPAPKEREKTNKELRLVRPAPAQPKTKQDDQAKTASESVHHAAAPGAGNVARQKQPVLNDQAALDLDDAKNKKIAAVELSAPGLNTQKMLLKNNAIMNNKSARKSIDGVVQSNENEREDAIHSASPAGGLASYNAYLEKNVHYPAQALEKRLEGKVTIEFTVESVGTLADFKVLQGLGLGCDEEAIRLIKEGPAWNPASIGDSIVQSKVRVRVKFRPPK